MPHTLVDNNEHFGRILSAPPLGLKQFNPKNAGDTSLQKPGYCLQDYVSLQPGRPPQPKQYLPL
jgi:hypothetical protein